MAAEIGRVVQPCTAVGTLRNSAAIVIDMDRTVIDAFVAVLPVVADVQCQAVRDQSLVRELKYQWCCTIKVDIENSKGQYIEKDKQEATKDGSESTKIQHGI